MTTKKKVTVGTRFRATLADGNPMWEVKSKAGKGVWNCEVMADEIDFRGSKRPFSDEEILRLLAWDDVFERVGKQTGDFYDSQPVGRIVHYDNGFGQFVRCEVVIGKLDFRPDEPEQKALRPIALVGDWQQFDVAMRRRDGSIQHGHNAQCIIDKALFKPNSSFIFESPSYHRPKTKDPAELQPLSLDLPPMTKAEEEQAKLWKAVSHIRETIDDEPKNPVDLLRRIRHLVDEAMGMRL